MSEKINQIVEELKTIGLKDMTSHETGAPFKQVAAIYSGKKKRKKQEETSMNDPWLSKRTGLILMIVISLALAIFVIWQFYPFMGAEAFLWGLGFAGSIWIVFAFFYAFNTWVRGRGRS